MGNKQERLSLEWSVVLPGKSGFPGSYRSIKGMKELLNRGGCWSSINVFTARGDTRDDGYRDDSIDVFRL